jgi:pimeloyl-ACP methyl ester carboxylesterase
MMVRRERPSLVLLSPYGQGLWSPVLTAMSAPPWHLCHELRDADSVHQLALQALAHCPPRFHAAGFCLGGAVAIEMCRLAGDRVQGLALINTSLAPDSGGQGQARRQRIDKLRESSHPDADYVDHAARWLVASGAEGAATAAQDLLAAVPISRSLDHQLALLSRPDPRPILAALRVQMLAISGDHDRVCTPVRPADLPPGAGHAAHLLFGCGHLSPLEQPKAVAGLLGAWLDRVADHHQPSRKGEKHEPTF